MIRYKYPDPHCGQRIQLFLWRKRWHLHHHKKDGDKEKAIDHSLYLLLLDESNPEMSSLAFRETFIIHLLL